MLREFRSGKHHDIRGRWRNREGKKPWPCAKCEGNSRSNPAACGFAHQFGNRIGKILGTGLPAKTGGCIKCDGAALLQNEHAISDLLNFAERVRCEKKSCTKPAHQIVLDQTAEVGRCEGVQAACGFV